MKFAGLITSLLLTAFTPLWSAQLNKYDIPLQMPSEGRQQIQQQPSYTPQRSSGLSQSQMKAIILLEKQDPQTQEAWIARMKANLNKALEAKRYDEADYYYGILRYWERSH